MKKDNILNGQVAKKYGIAVIFTNYDKFTQILKAYDAYLKNMYYG